jgi:hypothetical protein
LFYADILGRASEARDRDSDGTWGGSSEVSGFTLSATSPAGGR